MQQYRYHNCRGPLQSPHSWRSVEGSPWGVPGRIEPGPAVRPTHYYLSNAAPSLSNAAPYLSNAAPYLSNATPWPQNSCIQNKISLPKTEAGYFLSHFILCRAEPVVYIGPGGESLGALWEGAGWPNPPPINIQQKENPHEQGNTGYSAKREGEGGWRNVDLQHSDKVQ
jgi:hypothetical protein